MPEAYKTDGAEVVLLSWGSTRGAVREAVENLHQAGKKVGSLHFTEVWPLPQLTLPDNVAYWTVEGNATGQFARLLQVEWGLPITGKIERYDGMPIDAVTILTELT